MKHFTISGYCSVVYLREIVYKLVSFIHFINIKVKVVNLCYAYFLYFSN